MARAAQHDGGWQTAHARCALRHVRRRASTAAPRQRGLAGSQKPRKERSHGTPRAGQLESAERRHESKPNVKAFTQGMGYSKHKHDAVS